MLRPLQLSLVLVLCPPGPPPVEGGNTTIFLAPRNGSRANESLEFKAGRAGLHAADPECAGFDFSRCGAWMREHLPEGWRRNATAEEIACCKEQFKNIASGLPWWAWPLIILGVVACGICLVCCILKLGFELIKAIVCCPWKCCCGSK
mmetsp:Transcript_80665/g.250360  ORF Transcript_80665/g.250360 Transcript_80665/m.250360 type:complete len:148 (+) Transcript_80665:124-567(+)